MKNPELLHEIFSSTANEFPNKVAVVDPNGKYSYASLEEVSNKLATNIQQILEHSKKNRVGIFYNRSVSQIISILGILKAGYSFVPLDPKLPKDRLQTFISEADIHLIIADQTDTATANNIIENSCDVIFVDCKSPNNVSFTLPESKIQNLTNINSHNISIDNEAYCIFTSGSTGKPKGALIQHKGIVNTIKELTRLYHITSESNVLQFANLAFDASLSEIFPTFHAGATLYIPNQETVYSINNLTEYIKKSNITVAILPPSLADLLPDNIVSLLKVLVVAGEECSVYLAERLKSRTSHFINAYGPTETSICATVFEIPENFDFNSYVPIGKPIANIETYVVNEDLEQVADNVPGELLVGGVGVFKEYLHNEEKTKSVLIDNPFGKGKVYKTGDIVKRDTSGTLTYLGRVDFQIKIRGLRISPQEIENTWLESRLVRSCVVVDGKIKGSSKRKLIGYYTSEHALDIDACRNFLMQKLPDYAIPAIFVRLSKLPLTHNGKVDRNGLRERRVTISTSKDFMKKSKIFKQIKKIWQEILEVDSINGEQQFYNIGGDSLSAMQIISALYQKLNIRADIDTLLSNPSLNDFVENIESKNEVLKQKKLQNNKDLLDTERLFWSISQLVAKPEAYTLTEKITIEGNLDIKKVKYSLEKLVEIYPILRTNYIWQNEKPTKVIKNTDNIFSFIDLSSKGQHSEDVFIDEKISEIVNKPINLATDPILSATLIKLDKNISYLVFHIHHIATDAYGITLIIKKFWKIYSGENKDNQNTKYNDDNSYDNNTSEEYWKEYFSTNINLVNLPWDHPRPTTPSYNGKTIIKKLSKKLAHDSQRLTSELGISSFTFFRGIFTLLLHRLSGQNEFIIGTTVSLRDNPLISERIGAYINTLPVKSNFSGDKNCITHILEEQNEFIKCMKHKQIPFHKIVEFGSSLQNISANLPINVMFDFIKSNTENTTIKGLKTQQTTLYSDTAKFDLTLTIKDNDQDVELVWEYDTSLFDTDTIQRLAQYFETVIKNIVSDPSQLVSKVTIIPYEEQKRLLTLFKSSQHTIPQDSFIHQFQNAVKKFPNKIAVQDERMSISYEQLNQFSDNLATLFVSKGVKKGDHVGVLMERNIHLVTTILALWKIQATYVPIETDFPAPRISYMIEKANITYVATLSTVDTSFLPQSVIPIEVPTDKKELSQKQFTENYEFYPTDLAYIIFTSGSTGMPKGVMIEHLGMMNHLYAMIHYFNLNETSIIAQTASHCFDISVWQLVTALLVGGKIVIYSKDKQMNPEKFITEVDNDSITLMELVPSYLIVLIEFASLNRTNTFRSLQYMLTTGEAAFAKLITEWYKYFPHIHLVNAYGPAEASDDTNLYTFPKTFDTNEEHVPIGSPLENIKFYIVDPYLNLCPIGVKGEICIGGIAVGRGYINDLEKTESAFLIDPFEDDKKYRLYRTGDVGSIRNDGKIYYHGRSDFQVKIRGFRIELEEIENQLLLNSRITSAAIIVKGDQENGKQLIGFYAGDPSFSEAEIKEYLHTKLPEYMVPAKFMFLEKFPLNNSGKIDRNKLKDSIKNEKLSEKNSLSHLELFLLDLWKETLQNNNLQITDNFFAAGGDSLSCFRLINKLHALGFKLSVQQIFANPSIKQLVPLLEKTNKKLASGITYEQFPLTPIQSSYFSTDLHKSIKYNQCVVIKGNHIDVNFLKEALKITVSNHPILSASFSKTKQTFSQKYNKEIIFNDFSINKVGSLENERSQTLEILNSEINYETGKVFTAGIIQDANSWELYLVAHHLVCDIVSWNIFLEELNQVYKDLVAGKHPYLPSEQTTYQEWANTIINSNSKILPEATLYWSNVLQNCESLHISSDTLTSMTSIQYKQRQVNFGKLPLGTIVTFSKANSSIAEQHIMLAILAKGLSDWLENPSAAFMLEGHGRNEVFSTLDLSNTFGWFTTLVPFYIQVKDYSLIEICKTIAKNLMLIGQYGALSYENIQKTDEPEIVVNYLGKMNRLDGDHFFNDYYFTHEHTVDSDIKAPEKLEVDIYSRADELIFDIIYDSNTFSDENIHRFIEILETIMGQLHNKLLKIQTDNLFSEKTFVIEDRRLKAIMNRLEKKI